MGRATRLRDLVRSTPVRLALGLVALFSTVSLITLGLAYWQIRARIEAGIEANLDQHVAGFRVAATPEAMATLVIAEARAADPEARIFAFIAANGRSFGNARAEFQGDELFLRGVEGGRRLSPAGYVHRVLPAAGGLLVVAESRAPIADLRETMAGLLLLSLLPTVLMSLGAGTLIALASARRVRRIEATLGRLTQGDLRARVGPARRRDDDLARIGAGLDRMAGAQEASVAALRQVSADIAHDLKTPVQRIAVLLADLRDRLPEGGPEAAIAGRAEAEAERAVAVFNALLQIAQIEGGSPKARQSRVDLGALARDFFETYAPVAEDSGHLLVLDGPTAGGAVTVTGERDLLGQLIANLIENALRHTPAGTRITLGLARDGAGVALWVADNGPGIPASERGNVLRRLYRLERSRTTPGNGLGLALVAAIADRHGAALGLDDNHPGLRVTLRFAVPPAPPAPPDPSESRPAPVA